MKKINTKRLVYHVRHRYMTLNNVVIAVAFIIAMSWAWASMQALQRNYALQKEVDAKKRQLQLLELETQMVAYEQRYFKTSEYQEVAIRERLGSVRPGEKLLVLPPNSANAATSDSVSSTAKTEAVVAPDSNFQQWINFFFAKKD